MKSAKNNVLFAYFYQFVPICIFLTLFLKIIAYFCLFAKILTMTSKKTTLKYTNCSFYYEICKKQCSK